MIDNKFVKLSAPPLTLTSSGFAQNIQSGIAALTTLQATTAAFIGNPMGAIGSALSGLFANTTINFTNTSKLVGLDLPPNVITKQQARDSEANFLSLLKPEDRDAFFRVKKELDDSIKNVKEKHRQFMAYATGSLQVSSTSQTSKIEIPKGDKSTAESMHRDLVNSASQALELALFFRDTFLPQVKQVINSISDLPENQNH